jgi:shikimate 5-dehydrogenase
MEAAAMSERAKRLSRRNFLLTLGAGGAATAAAIVAKNAPPTQSADKSKRATRGYHATEHVNNYYRTTKV